MFIGCIDDCVHILLFGCYGDMQHDNEKGLLGCHSERERERGKLVSHTFR